MKSSAVVSALPLTTFLAPRRAALALTAIAALLALLATPLARAEDKPAATEPAVAPATSAGSELPAVNRLVYLDKLPTAAALIREAKEQGTTIQRIDRTDDSVVVVAKYADGHTDTTGYTTLAAASTTEEPAVVASASAAPAPATSATTTVITAPAPTYSVISYQPAPVYYETRYRYYNDPWDNFWGPLALGVGIGWATGGHGGYYHGHGGWSHGGWRH